MMKQRAIIVLLSILLLAGCSGGRAKPKDLPPLYPCMLTITQESVPLEGANVVLRSDSKWAVGGKTNEKGEVNLVTQGYYDGVPEGSYKITIKKIVVVLNDTTGDIVKQTDVVANAYKRETTTPLEITIGKDDNNKTFDIGKAANINVPITE